MNERYDPLTELTKLGLPVPDKPAGGTAPWRLYLQRCEAHRILREYRTAEGRIAGGNVGKAWKAAGFGARHTAPLEGCTSGSLGLEYEDLETAAAILKALALPGGSALVMGPVGAGKTQLACDVARALDYAGYAPSIKYRHAADLFEVLRAQFGERHRVSPSFDDHLLVVDGAGYNMTSWEEQTLLHILTRRYDRELRTLLVADAPVDAPPGVVVPRGILDMIGRSGSVFILGEREGQQEAPQKG